LIHSPDTFEGADVEGVLGDAVARMLALELAVGFFELCPILGDAA